VHEAADPELVILEYDLHGELRPAGTPFVQPFVMIMTIRDGVIVHSRDYTDPITGARLLGRVPELVAELTVAG
jgi:ketosteroid isomerase-like protein